MAERKILIFSTTFFPDPAVGAVRPSQWAKFLPANGWIPTVACRHYGYTATRESLDDHLSPSVDLHYLLAPAAIDTPALERMRRSASLRARVARFPLTRLLVLARVPDVAIRFWRSARKEALALLEHVQPDVILTTSPSHSAHDMGMWLSRRTGVPWVADFRDPYLMNRNCVSPASLPVWGTLHRRYEAEIYRRASVVLHAVPMHARWARRRYPSFADKVVILPNGVPPELVDGSIKPIPATLGRKSIRVVGQCGPREARRLALAVRQLVEEGHDLELRMVGAPPYNVHELDRLLEGRLTLAGSRPHTEALREIAGADVLICSLTRQRSTYFGLSSKLFEYLATNAPIVVLNPTVPDEQLTRGIPGIRLLFDADPAAIAKAIDASLAEPTCRDSWDKARFVADYRRDHQTAQLAEILNRVASK